MHWLLKQLVQAVRIWQILQTKLQLLPLGLIEQQFTLTDVTEAFEKVAIGPERKNKIMSEQEKELTAYHEAGHAIVGHVLPDSDMVHKVTIIPRGGTGGVTWFIPPEDKSFHSYC